MKKNTARMMITILVVAFVGDGVRVMIENVLNKHDNRSDIIRRIGRRSRHELNSGHEETDWLVKNFDL